MKKTISKIFALTIGFMLTGCAATYRPINPTTLDYSIHDLQDGVGLSYKYDVLRERGNKKYANKENKKGVELIAVKITNNTDTIINVGKDVEFYFCNNQVIPMEPMVIKESIRQIVPSYLPYLLLSFLKLNITQGNTVESFPIGLIIGPTVTVGNMAMAGSANKNMLNELYEYNILGRDIQKGETVYGIIGVRDIGQCPLKVRLKK